VIDIDYPLIDFDSHYYEVLDAWTRHLDPKIRKAHRGVEIVQSGKRVYPLIGGRLSHFIPNITFDPVAAPGSLEAYFRGEAGGKSVKQLAELESPRPEYQHRQPRLAAMDAQNVERTVLLPTFTCGVEEALAGDIEALHATLGAFNRWLLEEWGFDGRTVAAPMIALSDVEQAIAEVCWALDHGACLLLMTPGPVRGAGGQRHSPANPMYDPVWQLINDAGITVAYHAADSGYFRYFADYDDPPVMDAFSPDMRLGSLFSVDRPIQDMLGVMVLQRFFARFPNVRIVSIEQGSDWLVVLIGKLHKLWKRRPQIFAEDPVETVRRHLWVCPFWEEDIRGLAALIGTDRVTFGSDWPHPEGVAEPVQFAKYLDGFSADDVRRIMRENGAGLLELRPA
jgi:predicted TIM-barrel fold metal-dependent hydrolase